MRDGTPLLVSEERGQHGRTSEGACRGSDGRGDGGAARQRIRGPGPASAERRPRHALGPDRHPALRLQQLPLQRGGRDHVPAAPAPPTANCVSPPAPTTNAGRLERVFSWLQSKDIRNVELYGYPGNPFPTASTGSTGNIAGLQALKAMGD